MNTSRHRLVPPWMLLLIALSGCGSCGGCGKAASDTATRLARITGHVTLLRAGHTSVPAVGTALRSKDTLSTFANSSAILRYPDGTEFRIGPNTRVRLLETAGKRTLELLAGSLVSNAPKPLPGPVNAPPIDLSIETRYGKTRILPGSELSFALGGGSPKLAILHGEAQVLRQNGQRVSLQAGQTLSFALGESSPPAPAPQPPKPKPVVARLAPLSGKPLPMRLSARRGRPEFQPAKAQRFSRIPRRAVRVRPGTGFEIPTGASARLRSGALRLLLLAKAKGKIGRSVTGDAGEAHALELSDGAAKLRFTGGRNRLVVRSGTAAYDLRADEESWLAIEAGPKGPSVRVRTGAVRLSDGRQQLTLAAGEAAELRDGTWRTHPLAAPPLSLPTRSGLRVYADDLHSVALRLPASARWVEVARDRRFRHLLLRGAAQERVIVPAPREGHLYWRTKGAKGRLGPKGSATFERDGGRSVLTDVRPVVVVRDTGYAARILHQTELPALAFDFPTEPGAQRYRVAVYRKGHARRPVARHTVRAPPCRFEPGTLRDGDYLWSEVALGKGGKVLARGRMNTLEIAYDNARPQLGIAEPKPFAHSPPNGWVTRGVAPRGATLFIDGRKAPLDSKGRFAFHVAQRRALVYRLVASDGSESFWLRGPRSGAEPRPAGSAR